MAIERDAPWLQRARAIFPRNADLSDDEWWARHRIILAALWLHAPAVALFATFRGKTLGHSMFEASIVLAFAGIATSSIGSRRFRTVTASTGLMITSAILVYISGGNTEVHFHFFVMLSLITLYQDWLPYIVGIAIVAMHHGVIGVVDPRDVFDHPEAWREPWLWAGIHAAFVLAASVASVICWRIMEQQHDRSEASIATRERWFRALIENGNDVIIVVDDAATILYESPSSMGVLGYTLGAREGANGLDFVHPDDIGRTAATFAEVVQHPGMTTPIVLRGQHADGSFRWLEVQLTNLLDEPDVAGVVANFRDVTERKTLEEQLAHQAFHDPLTLLPNRALFLDRVALAALAHRGGETMAAVLYVDLDDFKTVNDGLGHTAGDSVLVETAARLQRAAGSGSGVAARLGGDEFALLLEDLADPSAAYEAAAAVIEAVAAPMTIDGTVVGLTASIGIAFSDAEAGAADLLRNADVAMYSAKANGKGRCEVFESAMYSAVLERLALKADLARGVAAGEFVAYYQPIVELDSRRVVSVEALARWNHPDKGVLAPAAFIELAEETGLIIEIGRAILDQACTEARSWSRWLPAGEEPCISVNISARQLQEPSFVADVAGVLAEARLPAHRLVLELTESMLMADADAAALVLGQLKELGVRLALDDFGTGYSSLSYLERFPVDVLKIDKSFTDGLVSGVNSPMIGAIVSLGQMLGLEILAEGIEHADQVARLSELGCRLGQGFLFARPVQEAEIASRVAGDPLMYTSGLPG